MSGDPGAGSPSSSRATPLSLLALAALGVVYGDIGTSPLYALRECFLGHAGLAVTRDNVFGLLSLVFWSLVIVVGYGYVGVIMRADNHGEGGELALMTLVIRKTRRKSSQARSFAVALGLFGSALLYADAMITPAISVLSAVEGLNTATDVFEPYVLPIAFLLILGLFLIQHRGTARIGAMFGPITLLWFVAMSVTGVASILQNPEVLRALNPAYAIRFFTNNGWHGFAVLGTVFLVVTGGEALYADMGHFGRKPIRLGWYAVVFPALMLNYLGQGALLLRTPGVLDNLFYRLAPGWALYPMVVLGTMATIIASQAVISGTFSLTNQAVQLGYSPRTTIHQTSSEVIGQVYVPAANWMLLLGTLGLMLGFRDSGALAGAYGVAVSMTMLNTSILIFAAGYKVWNWPLWRAALVAAPLIAANLAFLSANMLKIRVGGWFPLSCGLLLYVLVITWDRGRRLLAQRLASETLPVDLFLSDIARHKPLRVPGIALFLTGNPTGIPRTLLHNYKHNKILHDIVLLVTVQTERVPQVPEPERLEMESLGHGMYRATVHYGFRETPDLPAALEKVDPRYFRFDPMQATFFLGRENLITARRSELGMSYWQRRIFAFMSRNSLDAANFFRIPPNRVVELGIQLEI